MSAARKNNIGLPDKEVVSVFIESYVRNRLVKWNIKENEALLPSDTVSKHKIEICQIMLAEFNKCKSFDDWINVCYMLDKLETQERNNTTFTKNASVFFRITDPELLPDMVHAVMSYILSQVDQKAIKEKIGNLEYDKGMLTNEIVDDKKLNVVSESIKKKQDDLQQIEDNLSTLVKSKDQYKDYYKKIMNVPTQNSSGDSFEHYATNLIAETKLSYCVQIKAMGLSKSECVSLQQQIATNSSTKSVESTELIQPKKSVFPSKNSRYKDANDDNEGKQKKPKQNKR